MLFVFIIANLPLPIIFYMNCVVWLRFLRVKLLSRHYKLKKPRNLVVGWWLGNISMIFAFTPNIVERRIFVQNHWWLISYAIAATLSITGLRLQQKGLNQELKTLKRRRARASA
jgi:hypothetical protein